MIRAALGLRTDRGSATIAPMRSSTECRVPVESTPCSAACSRAAEKADMIWSAPRSGVSRPPGRRRRASCHDPDQAAPANRLRQHGHSLFPSQGRRERTRLRQLHDRPVLRPGAMRVVAIRDPANRMPQDLDRRPGDEFVIVRRAPPPQAPQLPGPVLAGLNVQPRLDTGEAAWRLEPGVRARPAPRKTGASGRGSSVMRHRRWACTTRFIGRRNAFPVFTRR